MSQIGEQQAGRAMPPQEDAPQEPMPVGAEVVGGEVFEEDPFDEEGEPVDPLDEQRSVDEDDDQEQGRSRA